MECGDCTVCCTSLKVPELNKSEGTKCIYCSDKCDRYITRPKSCAVFECEWLKGNLPLKPNECGFMVEKLPGVPVMLLSLSSGSVIKDSDTVMLKKVINKTGFSVITTGGNALFAEGSTAEQVMLDVKKAAKVMGVM